MKDFKKVPAILLFTCIAALAAIPDQLLAQNITIKSSDSDLHSEIIPRINKSDAEVAITNKENTVDLMINGDWLVIQFTNHYLEKLQQEIHGEEEEESVIAEVIRSMVGSGVRTLLDRAISISLYDISEIQYKNNTLEIYDTEGTLIFEDLEIDNTYIMKDFRSRDARRFVASAEKRLP